MYRETDLLASANLVIDSLLAVPVIMGNSICGVLQLVNRLNRTHFSDEDRNLIEIFAGYISSSIQNTLDGIRAKELARRDDLTGLFNDRYFHFRLRDEIRNACLKDKDLALLFLDLDRFKDINDRYGHLEGSRVLHEVGALLEKEVPKNAVCARYGGDEYVIILFDVDVIQAAQIAEQLLRAIGTYTFLREGMYGPSVNLRSVTASIGISTLCEHVKAEHDFAKKANELIRHADRAMYRAKAEGRNRIVVANVKTKEYPIATPSR